MDQSLKFSFDLPLSSLHFMDNCNFMLFEAALNQTNLIGIDTETKPKFHSQSVFQPTSIIQFAIRTSAGEQVFIIDMLTIRQDEDALQKLDLILLKPFSDATVIKIGQGLRQDLQELRLSYPTMDAFKRCKSVLETNTLHRHLHSDVCRDISLKELTRSYLHFELDKTYQISNWARRPLSMAQLHYAACDSLVLLRLFDVMKCEAEEMGIFDANDLLFNWSCKIDVELTKSDSTRKRKSADDQYCETRDSLLHFNFYCAAERIHCQSKAVSPSSLCAGRSFNEGSLVRNHMRFDEPITENYMDKQIEISSTESKETSAVEVSVSSVSGSSCSSPIPPCDRRANLKTSTGWLPLHRRTKQFRASKASKLR